MKVLFTIACVLFSFISYTQEILYNPVDSNEVHICIPSFDRYEKEPYHIYPKMDVLYIWKFMYYQPVLIPIPDTTYTVAGDTLIEVSFVSHDRLVVETRRTNKPEINIRYEGRLLTGRCFAYLFSLRGRQSSAVAFLNRRSFKYQ